MLTLEKAKIERAAPSAVAPTVPGGKKQRVGILKDIRYLLITT